MDRLWIAAILLLCLGNELGAVQRLPALRADLARTSVSGVSSGGYQAVQFHVALVGAIDAGHAMVTADYGDACAATGPPYTDDCDFDAAGAMLSHLLEPLSAPATTPTGELLVFDQRAFMANTPYTISMDTDGFLYVPPACRAGR